MSESTSLPAGDPVELGFDVDRLARIAPAMQAYIDARKVPNLATVIVRRGRIVHHDVRGVMDFESQRPVDTGTLFRLFSNTKPIAAVATMILHECGLLGPDDPVTRFVPELQGMRVQVPDAAPGVTERVRRDITVRDCLTNTTGLHTVSTVPLAYRELYREPMQTLGLLPGGSVPPVNSRERMAAIAQLPLAGQPGKLFAYHAGYPILGAVLEAAAGQSMDAFFREQIFEPLGMADSHFYVPPGALDRFPACYAPRSSGGETRLEVVDAPATSEKVEGPRVNFGVGGDTGGVLSTPTDYARFGQMLLNGGELDGQRILGRKSVELMCANHTGDMYIPMTGHGYHFGLGVAVYHGHGARPRYRSPGSYGWGGAAGTTYWADPAEALMGVCFTQVMRHSSMPGNDYQETFERLVYQALT